jgi:hypothetical protein
MEKCTIATYGLVECVAMLTKVTDVVITMRFVSFVLVAASPATFWNHHLSSADGRLTMTGIILVVSETMRQSGTSVLHLAPPLKTDWEFSV